MKINVTVDLSDFYSEEDTMSFSDEIKNSIAYKVKEEIWKSFKIEGLQIFDNQVKKQIELDKDLKIKEIIDELFIKGEVKKKYSSHELVSLKEYCEDYFNGQVIHSNDFMNKINNTVKLQAETISKELKDRYDLLFASQIVANLNKQGMLKDDIAKILLEK